MNTRKILASALLSAAALVYAHAAELPLADLPADTAVVLDLDQKTFLSSEAGKILSEEGVKLLASGPLADNPLAQLKQAGVDPKSIDRVVLAGGINGGINGARSGIAYIYGKIDQATLDKIIEKAVEESGETAAKSIVGERTVTTIKTGENEEGEAQSTHFGIARPGLLLVSDSLDILKLAFDIIDGKAASLGADAAVAKLAKPVSEFSWLGLYVDGTAQAIQESPLGQNPQAQQVKAARLVVSGEMRNVTLKLDGKLDSAENAANIQNILMGFKAMSAMNNDQNVDPLFKQILNNLKVSSNGTWVIAETHAPVDMLVKKLQEVVQQAGNEGFDADFDE